MNLLGLEVHSDTLIVFSVFWLLTAFGLCKSHTRQHFLSRTRADWLIDVTGLAIQGFLIPLAQTALAFYFWPLIGGPLAGSLQLNMLSSFIIQFVIIDYIYYWNHRLLHRPWFWSFHVLHHSTRSLDVWATSRNSLITPLFFVYIWAHSFFIFLLQDARPFLLAAAVGAALDLWRHSSMKLPKRFESLLGTFLILPRHHAWHHSRRHHSKNFGANFSIWDRIHGTLHEVKAWPDSTGVHVPLKQLTKLWVLGRGES